MEKFLRVEIDNDLCAISDGMPKIREANNNECLISFYDDDAAAEFEMFEVPFDFNISGELTTIDNITFRETMEHEVFMIFNNPNDKQNFIEWWKLIGSTEFLKVTL
jgi:hypothetical protein